MPIVSSTNVDRGPSHGVRMVRTRVPMRDGVHLNAAVYTPRSGERVPAVVELTPYTVDSAHGEGQYFPSRGLGYVVADVRGRGDSEGDFQSLTNDPADAFDLIEWTIRQPWSDGRVVLYGGSYSGVNQWLILGTRHPAIAAASPAAAPVFGLDIPIGGVPTAYEFKWRALVWGRALYAMSGADSGLWVQEIRDAMNEGRPIWTAAEPFGVPYDERLRRSIERPGIEHWTDNLSSDEQLAGLETPVLTVTGTHDDCMPGTIYHWRRFERLACEAARDRSHLLIGPWDHAGTDSGHNAVGDLQFDEAARLPMRALRTDWFRHILFDEPIPELLSDRFVYYVAGSEAWRSAPSLDAATVGTRPLALKSTPGRNDVFHSGWLLDEPADGPDLEFTLDPSDARTLELELVPRPGAGPDNPLFAMAYNSLLLSQAGNDPTSQYFTMAIDGDGLVYHSAALAEQMTVVGIPRLRLVVVPDRPEADLCILVHEVRSDGSAIFVSSSLVRLSRNLAGRTEASSADATGADTCGPESLRVHEQNIVDIEGFRFCSRTFQAGSRVRLTLRSAWSTLTLPAADGLRSHLPVTVRVIHRADDGPVLTLPLGS